jgi:hypothetical protein
MLNLLDASLESGLKERLLDQRGMSVGCEVLNGGEYEAGCLQGDRPHVEAASTTQTSINFYQTT